VTDFGATIQKAYAVGGPAIDLGRGVFGLLKKHL
jgi:hypothetical protein